MYPCKTTLRGLHIGWQQSRIRRNWVEKIDFNYVVLRALLREFGTHLHSLHTLITWVEMSNKVYIFVFMRICSNSKVNMSELNILCVIFNFS